MPQFTIRDLLWLILVVGLSLGWAVDHRNWKVRWEDADIKVQLLHKAGLIEDTELPLKVSDGERG